MQRVLLIGSGRRIQDSFIPAFRCLSDSFTLVGIHSKTPSHYHSVAKKFTIPPIDLLDDHVLNNVDVIVISVPRLVWPEIIKRIALSTTQVTLVIDTPLQPSSLGLLPTLKKFKRIIVAEDYMSFPQFELMRTFAVSGSLGALKELHLINSGYRYHGTALIRSFLEFSLARHVSSIIPSANVINLTLTFADSVKATITEPYIGLEGPFEIIGTRGSLTTHRDDSSFDYHLEPIIGKDNLLQGFQIREKSEYHIQLIHAPQLHQLGYTDEFAVQKIHGLIKVLESATSHTIHSDYHFSQALYDAYISELPRLCPVSLPDLFAEDIRHLSSSQYWMRAKLYSWYVKGKRRLLR